MNFKNLNMFIQNKRYVSLVGFFLLLFILCVYLTTNSSSNHILQIALENPLVAETDEYKNEILKKAKECLIRNLKIMDQHPTSWWIHISATVKECAKDVVNYVPYIEGTPNVLEHKYYMVPLAQYINDPCHVITFGIGGDISSEQHIKRALPTCTFLGFDPNAEYKTLFTKVLGGAFVHTAVAGKSGVNTIMQLGKSDYAAVPKIPVKAAAELIETYHGKDKIIDILNIDVEGSEYGIFESILKDKIFQNVCQFNVEIHPVWFHDTGYTYYDSIRIFRKIIEDGTFIWVQSTTHSSQFYPSYFVNVKNSLCINKYLKGRLL